MYDINLTQNFKTKVQSVTLILGQQQQHSDDDKTLKRNIDLDPTAAATSRSIRT